MGKLPPPIPNNDDESAGIMPRAVYPLSHCRHLGVAGKSCALTPSSPGQIGRPNSQPTKQTETLLFC